MPGREPLSSLVNFPALEAETERVIGLVRSIQEAIDNVSKANSLFKNSKGGSEGKAATDGLIESNQRLIQVQQQLNAERQKSLTLETDLAKQVAIQREVNKQKATDMRAEAREAAGLNDAYKKLDLQQKEAARTAKNIGIEQGMASEAYKKASAYANSLSDTLKKLDADQGQHTRKVGDYVGAVSILEKALGEVKVKLDQFTAAGNGNAAEAERLRQEHELLTALVNQQAKGFTSVTMELRANERALASLRAAGMEGTEAFEQLQATVVKATRHLNEFRKEQKLLESAAPNLAALTTVAKGLGGAYAFGAGASALFADGNEKVEKELQKLVAVMTVLQGLNEIHEVIEKRGAIANLASAAAVRIKNFVMTGSTQTTRQNTAATLANAAAQNVETEAVKKTSAALVGLRFAAMATGIGALLLLLPLFASGMSEVSEESKEAAESAEELEERLKEEKEIIEGVSGEYQKAVQNVTELKINVELAKQGFLDKKHVVDEYNESMGKTTGLVKDLDDVEKKLEDDAAAYIQFTLLKAAANIALGKAAEKAFQAEIEGRKKATEYKKTLVDTRVTSFGGGFNAEDYDADTKRIEAAQEERKKAAVKQIDDQKKEMTDIAERFQQEAAEIAKKMGFNFFGDNKEKKAEVKQDFTDYEEGFRQLREEFAKFHREAFNIDVDPYIKELQTLQEKYQEMYIKANDVRDKDLAKIAENEKKKIITVQQANKLRLKIDQDVNLAREAAESAYYANLNALQEKHRKEVEAKAKEQADKDLKEAVANQQKIAKALADDAKAHFRQQTKIAENDDKANPSLKNDLKLAKSQREEQMHDITALYQQGKITAKEYYSGLDSIDAEYRDKVGNAYTKQVKKVEDYLSTVENLEKAVSERKIARIQQQMDMNNKLYENQRGNIERSTLNEQQKAAQLNVLAEQQKVKEDQLQKQKQAEQIKQARFEKAKAIFDISANTATAIVKAVAASPLTGGLPFSAIAAAIGAVQLAAVITKPLPAFASGTKSAPGGLALVGEKGQELMRLPGGQTQLTPATATLMDVPRGTEIIPHHELQKILQGNLIQAYGSLVMPERDNQAPKRMDIRQLNDSINEMSDRLAKNLKDQRINVRVKGLPSGWDAYIRRSVKE